MYSATGNLLVRTHTISGKKLSVHRQIQNKIHISDISSVCTMSYEFYWPDVVMPLNVHLLKSLTFGWFLASVGHAKHDVAFDLWGKIVAVTEVRKFAGFMCSNMKKVINDSYVWFFRGYHDKVVISSNYFLKLTFLTYQYNTIRTFDNPPNIFDHLITLIFDNITTCLENSNSCRVTRNVIKILWLLWGKRNDFSKVTLDKILAG